MNKFLLFILLAFLRSISFGQINYPYQDIKLEKPTDYSETEPLALSAAKFVLSAPFAESDVNRTNALKFLSTWMTGTKAYQFYLQGKVAEIRDDRNLLSLYLAAMVKYTLENKKEAANPMTVEHNASKLVIAYCDDQKNNFKLKKKYRKLLEE
jgi:hypothetical protein